MYGLELPEGVVVAATDPEAVFAALTDHESFLGKRIGPGEWAYLQAVTERHNDPGEFATIVAYLFVPIAFLALRRKEPGMTRPFRVSHPRLVGYGAIALAVASEMSGSIMCT